MGPLTRAYLRALVDVLAPMQWAVVLVCWLFYAAYLSWWV